MASAEADTKTDGKSEASPPVASAKAVPAAGSKKARVEKQEPDSLFSFWCVVIPVISLCLAVLSLVGLAYADVFPGSFVRPFFFGSPRALTKANFDEKVSGRTVFLKFYAPWCGHCKRIAPHWDKLAALHANHSFLEIADVDCTGSGQSICQDLGVNGYPALKYGDPYNLQDYKGGRTFEDLSKFAAELGPTCSPDQLQSCSEEEKKMITEFQAMGAEKREANLAEQEAKAAKLQSDFKEFVDSMSAEYKEATAKKEEAVKAVKDGGLTNLRAIIALDAQEGDGKKEEEATKEGKGEL